MISTKTLLSSFALGIVAIPSMSQAVYLNDLNTTVALGPSMAAEPFNNVTTAISLASIIDAPTADTLESHNQGTHVWTSDVALELNFSFDTEYDLTTLHFWNYFSEGFDVDNIDFVFFDADMNVVGSLLDVAPLAGGVNPIAAENYALNFPSKVQFVNAVLTGSNGEVDFNNIGFTGDVTPPAVPVPATAWLFGSSLLALAGIRRRR